MQVGRYGETTFDFSAARVTASVHESLQRLQVMPLVCVCICMYMCVCVYVCLCAVVCVHSYMSMGERRHLKHRL